MRKTNTTRAQQNAIRPMRGLALLLGIILLAGSKAWGAPPPDLAPVEFTLEAAPEIPADGEVAPSPAPSPGVIVIPAISTSRPSFTDAATTVPQGSFQAENGATYTNNRDRTYTWTVPETLLRLGITPNTELRYTVPNYIYTGDNQPGYLVSDFGDTSVGLSHHRRLPGQVDLAIIPLLNLPTGEQGVSTNSVDPELRVVLGKYWTPKWLMSSHLDTRWNTAPTASTDVVFNPTFINYYSLTDRLTGFLEYSGFFPTTGASTQYLQGGLLYLLTRRQQLDVRMAVGLNKNSPDFLVGFGYSVRIDGLFGESRPYATFGRKPAGP